MNLTIFLVIISLKHRHPFDISLEFCLKPTRISVIKEKPLRQCKLNIFLTSLMNFTDCQKNRKEHPNSALSLIQQLKIRSAAQKFVCDPKATGSSDPFCFRFCIRYALKTSFTQLRNWEFWSFVTFWSQFSSYKHFPATFCSWSKTKSHRKRFLEVYPSLNLVKPISRPG